VRRGISWLVGLALVIAAGAVVALEPPEQMRQAPFVVEKNLGERGIGRNVEVTFTEVQLADAVEYEEWTGTTTGVWLVVDLTAMNRVEPAGIQSFLLIGDREYRGSDRMGSDGIESAVLAPGIPTSGTIMFEIPRELASQTSSARVLISTNSDWRLDSAVQTTVDVSALEALPVVPVSPATKESP